MTNNDRGQSLITKYVWVIETIHKAGKISFNRHLIFNKKSYGMAKIWKF